MVIKMANSDWDNIPETVQKRFLAKFSKDFIAQGILSKTLYMPMERKKVGKWEALWLKLTFRKPPMVYILPKASGDTITIRRPHAYKRNKDAC